MRGRTDSYKFSVGTKNPEARGDIDISKCFLRDMQNAMD
jgi:hypothetical protein